MACEAEEMLRAKYATLAPSFCFMPVAVETLGALGEGAADQLCDVVVITVSVVESPLAGCPVTAP